MDTQADRSPAVRKEDFVGFVTLQLKLIKQVAQKADDHAHLSPAHNQFENLKT